MTSDTPRAGRSKPGIIGRNRLRADTPRDAAPATDDGWGNEAVDPVAAPSTRADLTIASERLLRDFDRTPEAIDYSELSARLWLIEAEARRSLAGDVLARAMAREAYPDSEHEEVFATAFARQARRIAAEYARLTPEPGATE